MNKTQDLTKVYELRNSFTIIGLTGRTGSGCSDIAKLLKEGFSDDSYEKPTEQPTHNADRKYKIVYNFAKENFKPYYSIQYQKVILLFVFAKKFKDVEKYLIRTFENINNLDKVVDSFTKMEVLLSGLDFSDPEKIKNEDDIKKIDDVFNSVDFENSVNELSTFLHSISPVVRIKAFQIFANNIRRVGDVLSDELHSENIYVYHIVALINRLIKGHKAKNQNNCKVVVDSLRNPLEIMYLKERYAAFYMMAVNSEEDDTELRLKKRYTEIKEFEEILKIDKEEYKGGSDTEFFKQNVSECIQKAEIHISNISDEKVSEFNEKNKKEGITTSPMFSTKSQLLKFVALIDHPGLITPSPEERSMQMAYTAKYNSGCISRQVGAVITDNNYSIKAIGWNNTPEGHTPCLLRSADDLINGNDNKVYSDYEKKDKSFRLAFDSKYIDIDRSNLKGRNVSFCFKCIQNSIKEGKNQVHTRSLHAEESAFLQISKYGGQGIKGGKLFTTASPCELCAKKAYQLGISVIYYVDPYPGISTTHILKAGANHKEIRLFHGAIGSAYHKLYAPFMAYKDELSILTGVDFVDFASNLKIKVEDLEAKNKVLEEEILKLRNASNV